MCGLLWWPGGGRPELGPSLVSSFLEEVASELEVEEVEDIIFLEDSKVEVMVEEEVLEENFVEGQDFLVVAGVQEEWWGLDTMVVSSNQDFQGLVVPEEDFKGVVVLVEEFLKVVMERKEVVSSLVVETGLALEELEEGGQEEAEVMLHFLFLGQTWL
jgi:hypothetical protein